MELNPFSITSTLKRFATNSEGIDKDPDSDIVEGLSSGSAIGGIFMQVLCFVFSLYTAYIFARCYCLDFTGFAGAYIVMICCTPCFIPYLYYQHFVNKCGKGQIGSPS